MDTDKISEDKKIEILKSLSESCWKEFESRRIYEWRVSFGLWTAIGIIIGFALKEKPDIVIGNYFILLILSLVFVAYIWFQYGIWKGNSHDQNKRHIYNNKFIHPKVGFHEDALNDNEKKFFKKRPTSSRWLIQTYAHGAQIIITLALLIILVKILWEK